MTIVSHDIKSRSPEEAIKNLLAAKVYPEIPQDFSVLDNDIHPQALLDELAAKDPEAMEGLERMLRQWKLQDKYFQDGLGGDKIKTELTILNLLAAYMLVNAKRPSNVSEAVISIELQNLPNEIEKTDLELIEVVAMLANKVCKTKEEKIDFYREHLSGMEKYKDVINDHFKNEQ